RHPLHLGVAVLAVDGGELLLQALGRASCSNGNACTVGEYCNGGGSCIGVSAASCNSPPSDCYILARSEAFYPVGAEQGGPSRLAPTHPSSTELNARGICRFRDARVQT